MGTQTIDTAAINARIDLRQLAGNVTQLHREAVNELAGPCPRCGGEDRFHVTADWWFCRACHEKRSDAIGFMQWLHNVEFLEAVKMLDSNTVRFAEVERKPEPKRHQTLQDPAWIARCTELMRGYRAALHNAACPGYVYAVERGFTQETLLAYGAGYDATRKALALPWFRAGQLYAIHYRMIDPTAKPKMKFEPDSKVAGLLFGKQAIRTQGRALFVVEGELNAMSIYQVAHSAGVDVLSIGSESAAISPAAAEYIRSYPTRIIWMDKQEVAVAKATAVGAHAFWSHVIEHEGRQVKCDANELLQRWGLAQLLVRVLTQCKADVAIVEALHGLD